MCGTLQLLFFLGYAWVAALAGARAYRWISAGSGLAGIYLRSVLFGGAAFLVLCTLPILAKWLLIGRWKPRQIRIWSLGYVRFWIVRTLVRSNPLALLAVGSPLYVLYLRALGAKVGRGTVIFSKHVPVCTDLLTIGPDTVIRKDAFLTCYRAHAGWIQTGPVTLGRKVFVGEKSVLDINTSMGDAASLGHTSALHAGQAVPAGQRWHGSPAQRTDVNYIRIPSVRGSTPRQVWYCAVTLLCVFLLYLPLAEGAVYLLVTSVPWLGRLLNSNMGAITSPTLYTDALGISLLLFFGLVLAGLLFVVTVPRLLNLFIKPDTVYPLYGFHDRIHRVIARATGMKFFTHLFGDSSYIVYYLRWIGYDLGQVEQTGFELRHGGRAHDPVPERDRPGDNGRGRPVAHERRLLEHVLPGVPGVDRARQLHREQRQLSGRRAHGQELPARHQDDDPARRGDPRRGGAAGLAAL